MNTTPQNQNSNMDDLEKPYLVVHRSDDCLTIIISMDAQGIDLLSENLERLKNTAKTEIVLALQVWPDDEYPPVKNLVLQNTFPTVYEKRFGVNYAIAEDALYLSFNKSGLYEMAESLTILKINAERGKADDISYMIDEWGGTGLVNSKFMDGASPVAHLRLYNVVASE